MSELLCKDCVYSRCSNMAKLFSYLFEWKSPEPCFYKCAKTFTPSHVISHPVTGATKIAAKMAHCEIARMEGKDNCGPDAKYWTPKKKKDLFKFLAKEQHG